MIRTVYSKIHWPSLAGECSGMCRDITSTRIPCVTASDTGLVVAGKEAIASMTEGDEQRLLSMGLKRFTKADLFNVKDARRRVAAGLIEANDYIY